jgi:hypothetical protein
MLIYPLGSELFHADGRTDRHVKLIVTFCSFADMPNNVARNFPPYLSEFKVSRKKVGPSCFCWSDSFLYPNFVMEWYLICRSGITCQLVSVMFSID